ncbi:MAG: 4Fe-4S dicluster domain-containing protein [Syntrophomonadaceae bacterium]|nr:4Fe-4S dicluster domain-containing protein [Syntrophomonadaceae bacterium]
MRYAMVIDIDRCTGCNSCAVACKVENNLPNDIWWNRILTVGGETLDTPEGIFPNLKMKFLPLNCQHCENPSCVKACPVKATFRREENGVIVQDYDKCIGCRMCMVACPYNARSFNWKRPEYAINIAMGDPAVTPSQFNVVEKCNFCSHRLARELKPACIDTCPNRARFFGDINSPNSEISRVLQGRNPVKILEEKGTMPSVYYLT